MGENSFLYGIPQQTFHFCLQDSAVFPKIGIEQNVFQIEITIIPHLTCDVKPFIGALTIFIGLVEPTILARTSFMPAK